MHQCTVLWSACSPKPTWHVMVLIPYINNTFPTGAFVAFQYPDPHCLCYRTHQSDRAGRRGCCSLYRSNLGLAMLWILFLVLSGISRTLSRLVVCLVFAAMHCAVTYMFRRRFMRHGYPGWSSLAVARVCCMCGSVFACWLVGRVVFPEPVCAADTHCEPTAVVGSQGGEAGPLTDGLSKIAPSLSA